MKQKYTLFILLSAAMVVSACLPEQRCYRNEDCDSPKVCNAEGTCVYVCHRDFDCGQGFVCKDHLCTIDLNPDSCADGSCAKPECTKDSDCSGDWICVNQTCRAPSNPDPCADGSCAKPECTKDSDCSGDWICVNQTCRAPSDPQHCEDDDCEEPECTKDEDCDGDLVCKDQTCQTPARPDPCADGSCETPECTKDEECAGDWVCKDQKCSAPDKPKEPTCPAGMSLIQKTYCMDKYEASRPDATESSSGSDNSMAVSKAGVMPWLIGDNNAAAEAACQAAGKRLCTAAEWEFGCHGANNTVYGYGDVYNPTICNGLDTFGINNIHIMPTGSFPDCNNGWDVYDLSGNLWEHTADGSGQTVRGGAFNCMDSEGNHKCSYVPQYWTPLSMGFRCCSAPVMPEEEPEARNIQIQNSIPEDIQNIDTSPDDINNPFFISGHEILLAWNGDDSDTMTDAVLALADSDAEKVEYEMTVDAAKMIGLQSDEDKNTDCVDPNLYIDEAQVLWQNPETARDAVKKLKDGRTCHPDNADIQRALGIAYARSENFPWAIKTLSKLLSDDAGDCEARAWLAWTYLQMGMTDEVEKTTKYTKCSEDYLKARIQLVDAFNAITQNRSDDAKDKVKEVYDSQKLTESDADALKSMQNMVGATRNQNMTWKVELDAGYASNALSGSPTDPRLMNKNTASPFLDGDVRLTLDPWKNAFTRVIFEGQVNGQMLFAKDAADSSYLDVSFRPGIVLDWENIKFGTYYRPEFLIVKGGDIYNEGPLLNYFSHRLELDVELYQWLYLFGGYGHRTFRQRVRTRDEIDIGAGGHHPLGYGLSLTWGATYRHWFSAGDMYDLNGTNVSLALDYKILDILFRLNSSFALDDYADSKGYFDAKNDRRDYLVKGAFQIWSPSFVGIRVGAQFKASRRWSSADDYDYTDYRGLIAIRWTGDLDFYAPHTMDDNYTSLPWNLKNTDSAERIRDIIQQDEDLQRSSSCLQN